MIILPEKRYSFFLYILSKFLTVCHARTYGTHVRLQQSESHSGWHSRSLGRPWYSWDDTRRAPSPRRRWDLSIYKCRSTWHSTVRFVIITASRERAETRQTAVGPSHVAGSFEISGSNVYSRFQR